MHLKVSDFALSFMNTAPDKLFLSKFLYEDGLLYR